ncbi:uncharacterized protein LOC135338151 isoform X2 [Halichondria panicea]|uniref:uncharacterized protein LOC135338151 isoform X2 n=1 Tax=Halichondria panicea TaxID=6063 RepID=UPI00312B8E61
MDALEKSLLEGDDAKQKVQVPREVHGILTVHIKTILLKDMEVDSRMLKLLTLNVTLCHKTKYFTFQQSSKNTDSAVCDSIKHWSVKLPEDCTGHDNNVLLELVTASPLLPHTTTTLSKAVLHLHDIIHTSPLSGKCELTDLDTWSAFGTVYADWAFCYGDFGYGESFQLRHSLHKPQHYLHYCLFPRLTPPTKRADHNGIHIPQDTLYSFLSTNQ